MKINSKQNLFSISMLSACCLNLFSLSVYAQEANLAEPQKLSNHTVKCPTCESVVALYNHLVDQEYNQEIALHEVNVLLERDKKLIANDQKVLTNAQAMSNSTDKVMAVAQANRMLKSDMNQYQNDSNIQYHQVYMAGIIHHQLSELDDQLLTCEKTYCPATVSTGKITKPFTNKTFFGFNDISPIFNLGLFFGSTRSNRTVKLDGPLGNGSSSHSQNNALIGGQLNVLFGNTHSVNPMFIFNGAGTLNSSNTLAQERSNLVSLENSNVKLSNDSIFRAIVGAQSKPFFNYNLMAGAGFGAAMINQILKAEVSEMDVTSFTKNQKSIQPSFLAELTWNACPFCLSNHGIFVTAQITADRYPSISTGGVTSMGNQYNFSVNGRWQSTEMIVFSTNIGK